MHMVKLMTTFDARSLWANQVPYVEANATPIIVGYLIRLLFVAKLRANPPVFFGSFLPACAPGALLTLQGEPRSLLT